MPKTILKVEEPLLVQLPSPHDGGSRIASGEKSEGSLTRPASTLAIDAPPIHRHGTKLIQTFRRKVRLSGFSNGSEGLGACINAAVDFTRSLPRSNDHLSCERDVDPSRGAVQIEEPLHPLAGRNFGRAAALKLLTNQTLGFAEISLVPGQYVSSYSPCPPLRTPKDLLGGLDDFTQ
jgi:hypothetical protein